jgi:hypothetical protein
MVRTYGALVPPKSCIIRSPFVFVFSPCISLVHTREGFLNIMCTVCQQQQLNFSGLKGQGECGAK